MSHLGDRLAALVDGELDHSSRDRMLSHLMLCPECRCDVDAHRAVKQAVIQAEAPAPSTDLYARLGAIGANGPLRPTALRPTALRPTALRPTALRPMPATTGLQRPRGQRSRLVAATTFSLVALSVGVTAVVSAQPRQSGGPTPLTGSPAVVRLPAGPGPGPQTVSLLRPREPVLQVRNAGLVSRAGYAADAVSFPEVFLTGASGR